MKKSNPKADNDTMKTTKIPKEKESKRLPKPVMNWDTQIVLDCLLPFLNLKDTAPNHDLIKKILPWIERRAPDFTLDWFKTDKRKDFIKAWEHNPEAIEVLRDTLKTAKTIIRCATIGRKDINEEAQIQTPSFLEKLTKALEAFESTVAAQGISASDDWFTFPVNILRIKGCGFPLREKNQKTFDKVWIPGIRSIILRYVLSAFDPITSTVSYPIGWYFIGCCHKEACGKIFRKTRSNQDFCSPSCQTSAGQKRYREKKR